jgi:hypothetical protein
MERAMTKLGIFGAAAIVACALAGPAMAQQETFNPGRCAPFDASANCQTFGPGNSYRGVDQRRAGYRQDAAGYRQEGYRQDVGYRNDHDWNGRADRGYGWTEDHGRDHGFWPAQVAAGVVGGAIGTGVAIATAPLRADSYAWDNGSRGGWTESYMKRNGFVCVPGTWFRGEDGRQHICQ